MTFELGLVFGVWAKAVGDATVAVGGWIRVVPHFEQNCPDVADVLHLGQNILFLSFTDEYIAFNTKRELFVSRTRPEN
jgi:hypothetical protein